jgi:hypothetical protein
MICGMTREENDRLAWALSLGLIAEAILAVTCPRVLAFIPVLACLFFSVRLGANTIRAFVQGLNEGQDPRHAKRPPDAP